MDAKILKPGAVAALCALAWVSLACAAWADHNGDTSSFAVLAQESESLTAEQAAAMVRSRTDGQVLSVRTISNGERTVHRVKVLLSGGRVKVFVVPASRG